MANYHGIYPLLNSASQKNDAQKIIMFGSRIETMAINSKRDNVSKNGKLTTLIQK